MKADTTEFVWKTHQGQLIPASQMRTSHVFYVLRMLLTNCPGSGRPIPNVKRWNLNRPVDYQRQAVRAFIEELERRDDLEEVHQDELSVLLASPCSLLPSTPDT